MHDSIRSGEHDLRGNVQVQMFYLDQFRSLSYCGRLPKNCLSLGIVYEFLIKLALLERREVYRRKRRREVKHIGGNCNQQMKY